MQQANEKHLISIIVPVYKVEAYLNRCIKSIIDQTYRNLDIIVVDDGSPDQCPGMCDEWAGRDSRIRVIHKENGGLSDARNAGIEIAKGKYLCFVDSDDWILPTYIETLYGMIQRYHVRLSVVGIMVDNGTGTVQWNDDTKEDVISSDEALRRIYTGEGYRNYIVAWNKMYHRELFCERRYPVGKLHEDSFITHELLYEADSIAVSNAQLYVYTDTSESITRSPYTLRRLDEVEGFAARNHFLKDHGKWALWKISLYWYLRLVRDHYCKVKKYYPEQRKIQKNLLKEFRDAYSVIKRDLKVKDKIVGRVFVCCPFVYYKMFWSLK